MNRVKGLDASWMSCVSWDHFLFSLPQSLLSQLNFSPASTLFVFFVSHPVGSPSPLSILYKTRHSHLGWTPPRPLYLPPSAFTLPSCAPTASSLLPNFANLSLWVPPLVQRFLLSGSLSNNIASEAKAIIKSNALADLTSLTPLIP